MTFTRLPSFKTLDVSILRGASYPHGIFSVFSARDQIPDHSNTLYKSERLELTRCQFFLEYKNTYRQQNLMLFHPYSAAFFLYNPRRGYGFYGFINNIYFFGHRCFAACFAEYTI